MLLNPATDRGKLSSMPGETKPPSQISACSADRKLDRAKVARKVEQFFELTELSMELALAGIRQRYPEASVQEQYQRLAERLAIFREEKWRGGK